MQQKQIHIDDRFGPEYQGDYLFKEMCWAKKSRIITKYTKYNPNTGAVISSDYLSIQAENIMASLHSQPSAHPLSLEKILNEENGIPSELGEILSKTVSALNDVGLDELRFLLEQLDDKSRTQLLQTLGYVKSSDGLSTSSTDSQPRK